MLFHVMALVYPTPLMDLGSGSRCRAHLYRKWLNVYSRSPSIEAFYLSRILTFSSFPCTICFSLEHRAAGRSIISGRPHLTYHRIEPVSPPDTSPHRAARHLPTPTCPTLTPCRLHSPSSPRPSFSSLKLRSPSRTWRSGIHRYMVLRSHTSLLLLCRDSRSPNG
jgi:hypothetical protein